MLAALVAALLTVGGCRSSSGPELVNVSGVVTLDGKPLPGAQVKFVPDVTEEGAAARPSVGQTNDAGKYELAFSTSRKGVLPGKYRVEITTGRGPEEGPGGRTIPAVPETVPPQYNTRTTLSADVNSSQNAWDFELQSGG